MTTLGGIVAVSRDSGALSHNRNRIVRKQSYRI
jgi:hypothetical protein